MDDWQNAGLTEVSRAKAAYSESYFMDYFHEAAKNAQAIRFDVTNFKPNYPLPQITNYEFNTIIGNPSLLQKTTFYMGNQQVHWTGSGFVIKF